MYQRRCRSIPDRMSLSGCSVPQRIHTPRRRNPPGRPLLLQPSQWDLRLLPGHQRVFLKVTITHRATTATQVFQHHHRVPLGKTRHMAGKMSLKGYKRRLRQPMPRRKRLPPAVVVVGGSPSWNVLHILGDVYVSRYDSLRPLPVS